MNLYNINPIYPNEAERLSALEAYQIMDTIPETDFDELTKLASKICSTPIALIILLDEHRQWFKSKIGLEISQTPREHAFCAHTIVEPIGMMEVNDARNDERFSNNPLVTEDPNIVFYAGISLKNPRGLPLGTICVIDRVPRKLNEEQLEALHIIARQVITQMELRTKVRKLNNANMQLIESNQFMQRFATTAAHDLKNPLSNMLVSAEIMTRQLEGSTDQKILKLANTNFSSAQKLLKMVNDMLEYSLRPEVLTSSQVEINLSELLERSISMISIPENVSIELPKKNIVFNGSEIAVKQIIINLLTNAIRYNNKIKCRIEISCVMSSDRIRFIISDNGPGIALDQLDRIFEKNFTLNEQDRFKQNSTGIGLYTVKVLLEKLGGEIMVESEPGNGSRFIFWIPTP